jgi:hypothetical protein
MGKYTEVVDRKHGEGKLMKGDKLFHRVTYDITVCQVFHTTLPSEPPTPGLQDIQGTVFLLDDAGTLSLMRQDFTLVLQDGTKMDLQLGLNGEILTRKGFY